MTYKVLDTNIPLHGADTIHTLGNADTIIVLPETVLNELDSKKSKMDELGYQARSVSRLIKAGRKDPSFLLGPNIRVAPRLIEGVTVWLVSLNTYPDFPAIDPNIYNDRKIIEVAMQLQAHYAGDNDKKVVFTTNDVMCEINAEALGLTVTDFKVVDKVDFELTKELEVTDAVFRALHGKAIIDVDPKHIKENYNYKFSTPASEQIKIASISNGTISILGKDTESDLRRQMVNPRGADQLLLSRAILEPSNNLVICEAKAGTGKTLVSLSSAMRLLKTNTPYTSILYVRASINDVEKIEEVGFLPGSAEEKNAVYFHPLFDSLDFMARAKIGTNHNLKAKELEEKVEALVAKMVIDYNIEMLTGLGMRGRTFRDTVVIIDEGQGMSKGSMQKVLTRFGEHCKVIIAGSNNQIDNPNLTKFTNGLSVLLNDCAYGKDAKIGKHVVPLYKVVRSDFAEYAENLFSKDS